MKTGCAFATSEPSSTTRSARSTSVYEHVVAATFAPRDRPIRTDGALVRVTSPVYGSAAETTERLVTYVQAMYPRLGEHLPG